MVRKGVDRRSHEGRPDEVLQSTQRVQGIQKALKSRARTPQQGRQSQQNEASVLGLAKEFRTKQGEEGQRKV